MGIKIVRGFSLVFVLALTAMHGHAQQSGDPMSSAGQQGQALGQQLLQTAPVPTVTPGGENGGGTIQIPGQAPIPVNQFVPGVNPAQVQQLQQLQGANQATLNAAAQSQQQQLAQDPTAAGSAYRTIVDENRQYSSSIAGDTTLWSQTTQALSPANLAAAQQDFADCTSTTTYTASGQSNVDVNHQVSCENLNTLTSATIQRQVSVTTKNLTLMDSGYNATANFSIPFTVSDGTAQIVNAAMNLSWAGAVSSVTFTDYPTSFNNWAGTLLVTVNPATLVCTSSPGVACTSGSPGCSCSEAVTILLTANVDELVETFVGDPPNPLMGSDGWCTAAWTCTDSSIHTVDGVTLTASMLTPLYPTSPNNTPNSSMTPSVCWAAKAQYQCPYNLGNFGCWTTPSGATQCHTNTAGNTVATPGTTCADLSSNPNCSLQLTECAQNAIGYNNYCYVTTNVYNCPDVVQAGDITGTTHFSCAGSIRCAGEDCVSDDNQETNSGFTQMQGKLTVLQHMLADYTTDTSGVTVVSHPDGGQTSNATRAQAKTATKPMQVTPNTVATSTQDTGTTSANPTVDLFPGQAFECRKALGSTVDCCTETSSGGESAWMTLYNQRERQGSASTAATQAAQNGGPAQGSWAAYANKANWTLATQSQALTSNQETVTEDQNPSAAGTSTDVSLTGVMTAYRTSEQNNSSLKNSWTCTSEEMDLATQREAGACTNIGSYCATSAFGACVEKRDVYCCFNSPMSLAIRLAAIGGEQGVANGGFGTPEQPNCSAVGTGIVSTNTLSGVDTDDWIGRLTQVGDMPTVANVVTRTNVDRLTGSQSTINPQGDTRPNVIERTQSRMSTIDDGDAKLAMEKQAIAATPAPQAEPNVPGSISFSGAFNQAQPGMMAYVQVQRIGSQGAVSVNYSTFDETALAGTDYIASTGTLNWADGEAGDKYFLVQTKVNSNASAMATSPLQFGISLSNPTGGANLYPNNTGEVVLNLLPVAPSTTSGTGAQMTLSKQLTSQVMDQTGGVTLTYTLTAVNSGPTDIGTFNIDDTMPNYAVIKQWGNPNDPSWNQYCAGPGDASGWNPGVNQVAYCVGTSLPRGATLTILAVAYLQSPGNSVTNTCSADYLQSGGSQWYVTPTGGCSVTSQINAITTQAQFCTQRGGMNTGFNAQFQSWPATAAVPYSGGPFVSIVAQYWQNDVIFIVPPNAADTTVNLAITASGQGAALASAVYARISPCTGDLSLPSNNYDDPFSMQSCTLVNNTNGVYTLRNSMQVEITGATPSDLTTCRLAPGETYYINIAPVDPTSGVVSTANSTCAATQACPVTVIAQ